MLLLDCLFDLVLFSLVIAVIFFIILRVLAIFNMTDPKIVSLAWLAAGLLVLIFALRCLFGGGALMVPHHMLQ